MCCYLRSSWTVRKQLHIISLCKVIILWSEFQKAPTHLHFLHSHSQIMSPCIHFIIREISTQSVQSVLTSRPNHCFSIHFSFSSLLFSWAHVLRYEQWSQGVSWPRGTRWLRSLPRLYSLSVSTHTLPPNRLSDGGHVFGSKYRWLGLLTWTFCSGHEFVWW